MIVSNIQNTPKRNNYPYPNNNFLAINKTILRDEVSFGSKNLKIGEQDAELINDGINDIENISSNPSKSDLNSTDSLSMQEFLEKENEALRKQDIDLRHIEIDDIDIPKIEIPDLDIDLKLGELSDEIGKSTKPTNTFKPILLLVGIGTAILGTIYYVSKKNKKYNKSLDKKV